ncbi:MAG: hypothetical protein FWE33_01590 [Defluviitaleaceae bacterium]|nr:hypothetical protein [Defluviitaleaceae bacterium]
MKKRLLAIFLVMIALFSLSATIYAGPLDTSPPILPTRIIIPPPSLTE